MIPYFICSGSHYKRQPLQRRPLPAPAYVISQAQVIHIDPEIVIKVGPPDVDTSMWAGGIPLTGTQS
jgi:hypothetical protein